MKSSLFVATMLYVASSLNSHANDFKKEYLSSVKEKLKHQVDLFEQKPNDLKKMLDISEKDYFISASKLFVENKDTVYFLKPLDEEKLEKIKDKNPDKSIYSIMFKNKKRYDSDDVANFIHDKVMGVDEKDKDEDVFLLDEILSTYPNPTNSYANIILDMPFSVNILKGTLYGMLGREIRKYDLKKYTKKGKYSFNYHFNSNAASGVYYFHLEGISNDKHFVATKKISLIK